MSEAEKLCERLRGTDWGSQKRHAIAQEAAALIQSQAARIAALEAERDAAYERAAQIAERDVDWSSFGKAGIEPWESGPDAQRDYRLGIVAGRSIAAAIRAVALDANGAGEVG